MHSVNASWFSLQRQNSNTDFPTKKNQAKQVVVLAVCQLKQ